MIEQIDVKLNRYTCERNQPGTEPHVWMQRLVGSDVPKTCPQCNSPRWNTPRKNRGYGPVGSTSDPDLQQTDSGAHQIPHYRTEEYAGMSQIEAIVWLARSKGGIVRVADAKQMLVETGKTQSKVPYSIANSIIIRNDHQFQWVSPGTYQLLAQSEYLY